MTELPPPRKCGTYVSYPNANQQQNLPNNFDLRHGPNYRGEAEQLAACSSSISQVNANVQSKTVPPPQNPPMESKSGAARRTVFSANTHLQAQMPSEPFYAPPFGMLQVDAQFNSQNDRIARMPTDLRTVYLQRMREIHERLMTVAIQEAELKTMLDRATDYAARITKFVEDKEDSCRLPPSELQSNQAMWEEATALVDLIKTDINTKLVYYQAGTQPNAHDQRRLAHVRRLQAKIEPFGGNLDHWPNFKSKWQEYYHNCGDMSNIELFMKLDEFIIPNSDAYALIVSFDRAIDGSYEDAWNELCARYDNPRLQVDTIIAKLTCMNAIYHRRDDYLRAYTTISNVIHSLPRMNVDITNWDPLIVHIVERKMDDQTFAKWNDARAPREIARLQPLIDFLTEKIDRGDSSKSTNHSHDRRQAPQQARDQQFNRGGSNQSGHRNGQGQNAHRQQNAGSSQASNSSRTRQDDNAGAVGGAQQRLKSAIQKVFKCAICNLEQHKTYQCPTFLKLDLNGRLKKLHDRKLCENCIRPNCNPNRCTLRSCTNTGCDQKHNRLVCPLTFSPTVNNAQPSEPNSS